MTRGADFVPVRHASPAAQGETDAAAIDAALVAMLGDAPFDGHRLDALAPDALWYAAADHRVLPLVYERIATREDVPATVRSRFRETATEDAVTDLLREVELKRLTSALFEAGVKPLLFKGSQLAYSHYPRPDLRVRVDSDLLIDLAERQRAHAVLSALDYVPKEGQMSGDLVIAQVLYVKRERGRVLHAVDLHWDVASPQAFSGVLTYAELAGRSVPLPALGPYARGLSSVDALVMACVHRVAHHLDSGRLIWLYDIRLLARGFSQGEWHRFLELITERRMLAVCVHSLARTEALFPGTVPDWVWRESRVVAPTPGEVSAGYLTEQTQARRTLHDLRALPGWRARLRLAQQIVLPPESFMRTTYAPSSRAPLPVLYVLRLVRGAGRWMGLGA